jgi:hypothetical protein
MRLSLTLLLLVGAVIVGLGQNGNPRPDPNGTWEFDRERSIVAKSHHSPPEQIKITYVDPELKIRRQVSVNGVLEEKEFTYYTDGRGETNPRASWAMGAPDVATDASETKSEIVWSENMPQTSEIKSKTTWIENKIVTQSVTRLYSASGIIDDETVQEWRLSKDGKILTQTRRSVRKMPVNDDAVLGKPMEFKAVFKLISK